MPKYQRGRAHFFILHLKQDTHTAASLAGTTHQEKTSHFAQIDTEFSDFPFRINKENQIPAWSQILILTLIHIFLSQ